MSNYRRLISYIYAYEGGVKGKNIGFAKLEARNGQCKISVNVKKVYVGGNDLGVYLLSGKEEILLGKIFIRNGAGEFRTTVNVNNVDGRNCTMDQCYGLTVHDLESSWQSYTTIWEDAVAHAAEVELADVTAENRLEKELAGNQTKITEPKQPVYIRSVADEIEAEIQAEGNQETAEEIYPFENGKTGMIQPSGSLTTDVKEMGKEVLEPEQQDNPSGIENPGLHLLQPEKDFTNSFRDEEANPFRFGNVFEQRDEGINIFRSENPLQPDSDSKHPISSESAIQPDSKGINFLSSGNTYQHGGESTNRFDTEYRHYSEDSEKRGLQMPGMDDSIPELESIHTETNDYMPYITAPYPVPENLLIPGKQGNPTPEYNTGSQSSNPGRINAANTIPQYTAQQAGALAAKPWEDVRMKTNHPAEANDSKIAQFLAYRPTSDKSEQSFKSQSEPTKTTSSKTISEAVKTVLEPLFSNVPNKPKEDSLPSTSALQGDLANPQEENTREPVSFQDGEQKIKPKILNPESEQKKPLLGSPEELERLQKAEQEENNHQKIWKQFSKRYPKIQAFDYDKGCEILTIKPQDIGLLPRETWVFGNNSFLLHGYYNYRYLILARLENPQGQPRYLLGVPGHYYSNEKYMASMFGFPNFVLSKNQPTDDGRFGYWYTDVRLSNQ